MNKLLKVVFSVVFTTLIAVFTTSAMAEPEFCWRDSYGRGVGTIPGTCPNGLEKVGLLCYDRCPAGMERKGLDCHSVCPSGMRDDGLFCRKSEYGRGAGYPWKFGDKAFSLDGARGRCARDNPQGCEKNGEIIYPKCKSGYHAFGCCICRPDTPNCGALGLGGQFDLSCAKKIQIASAPKTANCSPGEEYDAGLCYKKCNDGYSGVGPVCWGKAPPKWVECGMGSAKDSTTCASIIFDQVSSVGSLAITVATLGSSSAAQSGANSASKAGKLAELKKKYDQLKKAYEEAKKGSKALQAAEKAYQVGDKASQAYTAIDTASNAITEEDIVRASAQIAAIVDSSGVSATIGAYTYPKCSKYFGNYINPPAGGGSSTPTSGGSTSGSTGGSLAWVGGPNVPANAVIGGQEPGRNLPVCRGSHQGGVHPGKVVAGKCNIGWGGKEITLGGFEVLINNGAKLAWVGGPNVPANAVIGGQEPGRNLPVCRGSHQGGVHPGKVVAGKCNIGWGGKEITLTGFEVLVKQ
ncbi:MAG: DUF3421 domain-containing protein [Burkholderiales bacterium]|nr:DUF3421 domain-containing protein [Burkholderiales bacterium]